MRMSERQGLTGRHVNQSVFGDMGYTIWHLCTANPHATYTKK